MHGEVTWDHLDRLVEAYAAASLYVSELRDLETRISRAAADILRYNGSFDDLTGLLATRSPTRELMTRRIAWAAQHVLRQRAWVVGSKLLVKLPGDSGWASPMLDQMRMLGFVSAGERESEPDFSMGEAAAGSADNLAVVGQADSAFEVPVLDKLDAMLASAASETVWLVKGCSYTQARRLSPDLWVNSDRTSLFGVDDRFMTRLFVSGNQLRSLLAARDLVQAAHPRLKVRAAFFVLNDPGCSWHFQAADLTSAKPNVSREARVHLDPFPVLATHRQFESHFHDEGMELAALPDWASDDPMSALPTDRPTRSLLMLQELWGRQLNRPKRLSTASGDELAQAVARRSAVSLGRDQWRHDLEDCLERSGFVRRLPDRPGRFAITPKGIARLLILRQKLGASPPVTTASLLSHITHQARLWAAAPVT